MPRIQVTNYYKQSFKIDQEKLLSEARAFFYFTGTLLSILPSDYVNYIKKNNTSVDPKLEKYFIVTAYLSFLLLVSYSLSKNYSTRLKIISDRENYTALQPEVYSRAHREANVPRTITREYGSDGVKIFRQHFILSLLLVGAFIIINRENSFSFSYTLITSLFSMLHILTAYRLKTPLDGMKSELSNLTQTMAYAVTDVHTQQLSSLNRDLANALDQIALLNQQLSEYQNPETFTHTRDTLTSFFTFFSTGNSSASINTNNLTL